MKILYIIAFTLLLFSGCADKTVIYEPNKTYYPTFPITDFNQSEPHNLDIYVLDEKIDNQILIGIPEDNLMFFIKDTKELRSNYNLLIKKIKEFNIKIKELNKKQDDQKAVEVK